MSEDDVDGDEDISEGAMQERERSRRRAGQPFMVERGAPKPEHEQGIGEADHPERDAEDRIFEGTHDYLDAVFEAVSIQRSALSRDMRSL